MQSEVKICISTLWDAVFTVCLNEKVSNCGLRTKLTAYSDLWRSLKLLQVLLKDVIKPNDDN